MTAMSGFSPSLAPLSSVSRRDWSEPEVPSTCATTVVRDVVLAEGDERGQALAFERVFGKRGALQAQLRNLLLQVGVLLADAAEVDVVGQAARTPWPVQARARSKG